MKKRKKNFFFNNKMELTELRMDRLKLELGKLELSTTGTKDELQRRLREQLQLRVVSESTARIKPPCFDGSSPLSVFKFQFDTVANRNGWEDDEKAVELILALKGAAILEIIPTSRRKNYSELMLALQRRFGDDHKREMYRKEIRCQLQNANEPLQASAMEVERLMWLTYPGENHPLIDNTKTEAFVSGIRDPDIKLAVCST